MKRATCDTSRVRLTRIESECTTDCKALRWAKRLSCVSSAVSDLGHELFPKRATITPARASFDLVGRDARRRARS